MSVIDELQHFAHNIAALLPELWEGGEAQRRDVDNAYEEMIRSRIFKEGSPTQAIREWSVLAHSVMELTGPMPFGEDGNVELWLHEKSLAKLLDMCDAVDEKFAALGDSDYERMYRELTDAVNELQKKQPYCYNPDKPVETLQTVGRFIDELNAANGGDECETEGLEESGEAMNSESGELKPCPFCGGEASWIAARQREDGAYYPATCGCRKCGIWRCGDSSYGHGGFATEDDLKVSMEQAVARWNNRTPERAIAATLGGNENRISERLRGVASDMRNIGASSMTPHELFAYWAREVDKAADLADFMCGAKVRRAVKHG